MDIYDNPKRIASRIVSIVLTGVILNSKSFQVTDAIGTVSISRSVEDEFYVEVKLNAVKINTHGLRVPEITELVYQSFERTFTLLQYNSEGALVHARVKPKQ
jgi:hypothetical protein